MARWHFVVMGVLGLAVGGSRAAVALDADGTMAQFFATWDNNDRVTPATVASLYAQHVTYYGKPMSTAEVYADKHAFVRRWPDRRYAVVPGTVTKQCDDDKSNCRISATLAYRAVSQARGAQTGGWTRVSLDLAREGGQLKIVRESGHPVSAPE